MESSASGSAKFESDRRYASAPSLPSVATSAVDDDMWPVACRNRTEPKAGERKKTVRSQRFAAAGSAEGCNVHKTRRRELDSTAPRACGHHRPLASRLTRARIRLQGLNGAPILARVPFSPFSPGFETFRS